MIKKAKIEFEEKTPTEYFPEKWYRWKLVYRKEVILYGAWYRVRRNAKRAALRAKYLLASAEI